MLRFGQRTIIFVTNPHIQRDVAKVLNVVNLLMSMS